MSGEYLDSVRLDEVHVERRGVGEDFAASLHRAEDVGPHVGQLRYGRFDDLPGLSRRLRAATRSAAAARLTRCGGGHVGVQQSALLPATSTFKLHAHSVPPHPPSLYLLPGSLSNHYDSLETAFGSVQFLIIYFGLCTCYLLDLLKTTTKKVSIQKFLF